MTSTAPNISTVVLVPKQTDKAFGSLYEITTESDEIFISGATVDDVEIIDSVTASRLRATGAITTTASSGNAGIQSTSNSGGSSY
jgi:hypothetical protein